MLHQLDESLERLMRSATGLAKTDVDIVFDAPDNEWAGRITKPTINLFLWDIRRSQDEHDVGRERISRNGQEFWRSKPPRMAFSYLVTAWTAETRDEHRLLGGILTALLANPVIADTHLTASLSEAGAQPTLRVARPDSKDFADFWSAIGGQLKPGLDLSVTATVDPGIVQPAGPPTEQFSTELVDRTDTRRTSATDRMGGHVDDPMAVGALVTSPRGSTRVDSDGNFLVPARPGDTVTIHLQEPETVEV